MKNHHSSSSSTLAIAISVVRSSFQNSNPSSHKKHSQKKMKGETVCVTGASGYIGSWLVMRLLERGYFVKAAVRDPGNVDKVKHLLELPKAKTLLSLWKADLEDEGSFDQAIHGCTGVFHVASPMEFLSPQDPENEIIKPTVNGVLNIMRSCLKATTVKRVIFTSTTGTVAVQPTTPAEYDESCWTDVDFCYTEKMPIWSYFVGKTMAEKAAFEFGKENGLHVISVLPTAVMGPFLTSSRPFSIELGIALVTGNEALQKVMTKGHAVHIDDICNAHIFLYEHPQANGRYICSSHNFTILDLAKSLAPKFPEYDIPTEFEGVDESLKIIPFTSKKLKDLGFTFKYDSAKYDAGDLSKEAIECCKAKGLL